MIKIALVTFSIKYLLAVIATGFTGGEVYSVWAEPGLHLMICDAGTPDNYEDDFVVDWEDNREVIVIHDR